MIHTDFFGHIIDLDAPQLHPVITQKAMRSGNYPYVQKLKRKKYDAELFDLQIELTKLQTHKRQHGLRILILFEGRDSAGKGGAIKAYSTNLSPRCTHVIALDKPSEKEQGQWYFQRYVAHLPSAGETMLFDRSWYNRSGVEPVMGYCSPDQHAQFLTDAPEFEKMLVRDGIVLFKFWLNIGRAMQIKRFYDRRHSPVKYWKLSPTDIKTLDKWDDYTKARNQMLEATHKDFAPWHIIRANDKRRARLNLIRHVLLSIDYEGKNKNAIGEIDNQIFFDGQNFLNSIKLQAQKAY